MKKIIYILLILILITITSCNKESINDDVNKTLKPVHDIVNNMTDNIINNINLSDNVSKLENLISNPIIEPEGPINVSYTFSVFNGGNHTINLTLYQSYLDFYKAHPINESLLENETFYNSFFDYEYGDEIYDDILEYTYNYSDNIHDQLEYLMFFISSIEYKFVEDFYYPYEFLEKGYGVCTEKSLLMARLISELGYGSAVIVFPENNHLAVGIECTTPQYDEYCFMDVTNGFSYIMNTDINIGYEKLDNNGSFVVNISEGNIYNSSKDKKHLEFLHNISQENKELMEEYKEYNKTLYYMETSPTFFPLCKDADPYEYAYVETVGSEFCLVMYGKYDIYVEIYNEIVDRGKEISKIMDNNPYFVYS